MGSVKGLAFIAVTAVLLYVALRRAPQAGAVAPEGGRGDGGGMIFAMAAIASLLIVGGAWFSTRAVANSMAENALDEARAIVKLKADDLGRWLEAQKSAAAHIAGGWQARTIADRIELRGWNRESLREELSRQGAALGFAAVDLIDAAGRSLLQPSDAPAAAVRAAVSRVSKANSGFGRPPCGSRPGGAAFRLCRPPAAARRRRRRARGDPRRKRRQGLSLPLRPLGHCAM